MVVLDSGNRKGMDAQEGAVRLTSNRFIGHTACGLENLELGLIG